MNPQLALRSAQDYFPPDRLSGLSASASVGGVQDPSVYLLYRQFWQNQNLPAGQVVLIALPNSIDLLQMFFAVLNSGLVPAMVAPNTPVERLKQMLEDFRAGALVRTAIAADTLPGFGFDQVAPLRQFAIGSLSQPPQTLTEPGQVLIATSGTSTSFSSGCVHAFTSLVTNARRHAASIGLRATDTVLVNLPLFYSTALVAQTIAALDLGARLVISGPPFSLPQYLSDLDEHAVSVSSLTPVLLKQLNGPEAGALPRNLRTLTVGGDFVDPAQTRALLAVNPQLEFYLTYGISEAGPRVSTCAAHRDGEARYASVGQPLEGTEVMLDPQSLQSGQGELLVSSSSLLLKKLGRNVHSPLVTLNGKTWLHTGDIFQIDAQGYLFFKGRKSDFLVINDEKVNLGAIKSICRALPGVISCRTRVHQPVTQATSFALEITLDKTVVPDHHESTFKESILKLLKRSERPGLIELVYQDAAAISNYK